MSEEALKRFIDRVNNDEAFAEKVRGDWVAVIDESGLSPAELTALGTQDEDALRRLMGAEVTGHLIWGPGTWFCTYGCKPPPRPGTYPDPILCGPLPK